MKHCELAMKDCERGIKFLVTMRLWETPVPMPNTMVKTQTADDTWWETAWESRWLPDSISLQLNCKEQAEGSQLSRLERAPDKREVGGSSPLEPT